MGRNLIVRTLAVLAVPISCALAFAAPASAAPPAGGTGGIVGTVTKADGSPLGDACISTDTGFSTTTDATGAFHLTGVSTGGHLLRIEDCAGQTQTSEWYDGVDAVEKAQTVWVYPGADTPLPPIALRAGAFIAGTVKNDAGPVGAYCVVASMDGTTFDKSTTLASGGYSLGPLPAGSYLVQFVDCRGLPDPYQLQWSPSSTDEVGAKPIAVVEGQTATGVDQNLDHVSGGGGGGGTGGGTTPAPDPDPDSGPPAVAVIGGRVTDGSGNPLQDICVVAYTIGSTAGSTQTDSTGNYKLDLNTSQPVKVQFVDCTGNPEFAGQWFPNRPTEAAGDPVVAPAGGDRSGIDATLAPGAPGSISGTVTNRRGHPIVGACVVAYLPYRYTVPALVGADGTFTIKGVPSGTFALGVLTCRDDDKDPLPWVDDPDTPGLRYAAAFWPHGTIRFDQDRVDPWTGGGKRIAVAPGQQLSGYDQCFGCVGITVDQVTPGHGSMTLRFTAVTSELFDPSMLPEGSVSVAGATSDVVAAGAVDPSITYTATCHSSTGGVTGSATSTTSPITVTGLTPGAAYTCSISAADAGGTIGTSDPTASVVASATGEADVPTDERPTELAATGNGFTTGLAIAGWTAWLAGLALTAVARSRRDRQAPSVRRPRIAGPGR